MTAFDTAERLAIVEEWKRQSAAWKPKQGYAPGCLMMIVAVALLMAAGRFGGAKPIITGLAVVLGIGGFIVMPARQLPGDPRQITGDALTLLASGSTDTAARRQAAVALLFHAWDQRGPTMSQGYDVAAAREALAGTLDYVRAVEQVLRDELRIAPVFTS